MFGNNRNRSDRSDRSTYNRPQESRSQESQGYDRDDSYDRSSSYGQDRNHQDRYNQDRYSNDDRSYAMGDRNESYIGSRGYQGMEDYPGARQGQKDFGNGDSRSYGVTRDYNQNRGWNNDSSSRSNYGGNSSYQGQPGLGGGAAGTGRYSSPSSQGYRAYQDYGTSPTRGDWSGSMYGGQSGYNSSSSYSSNYGQNNFDASTDRGHYGKGPKNYKRSDEKIHDEVCELLTTHYDIDASEIEVEVKDGVVTLGGTVESRRTKRTAEDVVSDMNGVQDVRNNLRVLSHDSRNLEASSDSKSNYRSSAASTDSTLNNSRSSSKNSSATNTTSTTRQ